MAAVGRVVLLNGAPRSGKSSIARAIERLAERPWVVLGVDAWMTATPADLQPGIGLRPGGERPDLEPFVARSYAALYEAIGAVARSGLDVVSDTNHHDGHATLGDLMDDGLARLAGLEVLVVGVHCALDVAVERRRATGYPTPDAGPAAADAIDRWHEAVHRGHAYDLELDTTRAPADALAGRVLARVAAR